ncbi:MAG: hypothetical protein JWN98_2258, partial [Abditibacteriota bacterium]|nr:hypothetical protein [Abditibacteriota bacterium]
PAFAALSFVTLLAGAHAARADQALVIGINHYPGYTDMDLSGPLNDAMAMSRVLKRQGFAVTMLTDQQATRDGVLQALQTLRSQIQPHERLVFYFSGHGARDARARTSLLPHDARVEEREEAAAEGKESTLLLPEQALSVAKLHGAVAAIPARGRTIIFDVPFLLFRDKVTSQSTSTHSSVSAPASVAGAAQGSNKTCYLLASSLEEKPREDVFGGVVYGVFTYFLVKHLHALPANTSAYASSTAAPSKAAGARWSEVFARVSADVTAFTEGRQHPRLSAPYLQSVVFEAPTAPASAQTATAAAGLLQPTKKLIVPRAVENVTTPSPVAKAGATWGEWSGFNVRRDRFNVQMRPDKIDVPVGQQVVFELSIAAPGYMVVLERGTNGKVNLVFPPGARIEQARVSTTTPESPLRVPADTRAFVPDAPDLKRIRAYWFADQSAAETLLRHFAGGRSLPDAAELRRPDTVSLSGEGVFTSDVLFEVVPPATP